ncbi:MAG: hypothetical protein H0W02_08865 [Ktedonobacteraceae bacterium]|nr:hypothetical protein [Ktedonobacteraceae bacterium]
MAENNPDNAQESSEDWGEAAQPRQEDIWPSNTPAPATEPQPPADLSSDSTLPPEAQADVNGGPLGCCLGVTVGMFLSLIVAVIARVYGDPLSHILNGALLANVRIIMGCTLVSAAIICGYIGWKIGKRLYREYELSPRQKRKLAHLEDKYSRR